MLRITNHISIDEREIEEDFVRSSGPGGQNVNKLNTAVQLRFDVRHSPSLPYDVRVRLERLAGQRLTKDGVLVLIAQRHRTQERNRQDALDRLVALIREAAVAPKPRTRDQTDRRSRKRRLESKKRRSRLRACGKASLRSIEANGIGPDPSPEVRAAISAFTRAFNALWRRASKGDGPDVATLGPCILRGSLRSRPRMTGQGQAGHNACCVPRAAIIACRRAPIRPRFPRCPSANSPRPSSTASPPARWSSGRRASVKELVENALDAGATRSRGRDRRRRPPAHPRHRRRRRHAARRPHARGRAPRHLEAADDDLLDIRTLGFRGEALPSIGSVARLTITTRHASEPHAWAIEVDGGEKSEVKPAALGEGTRVEVRDLFYATPARLKFLKTDRTEARSDPRRGAPPRDEPARCRLHARGRGARAGDLGGRAAGRARTAGAAWPTSWARSFAPTRSRSTGGREGVSGRGLRRAADAHARQCARAVSLRQRPAGARQAADRRGARRLCRLPAARPPSDRGAVRHARCARGRRQRASGQGRGALPRPGAGARAPDRARCRRRWRATASAPRPPAAAPRSRRFGRP